ncbi:MAG: alpha/beta fold hydrolase, partial [Pyrinomonadaceae bacterium]|nr:alpha/beta fold hydrolase [Phycisphaerales bacterium]
MTPHPLQHSLSRLSTGLLAASVVCIAATVLSASAQAKTGGDRRATQSKAVLGAASFDVTSRPQAAAEDPVILQSAITIERVASSGRVLLFSDAVEAQRVAGTWKTPKAGDTITIPTRPAADGKEPGPAPIRTWTETKAAADGWLPLPGGAYASWVVHSDEDRVMILEAVGHGSVSINNELHTGDPYEYGFVKVPVLLRKGDTELLFKGGRGRLRAQIVEPNADVMFNPGDRTTPDLVAGQGQNEGFLGSIVIMNTTRQTLEDVLLITSGSWHRASVHPLEPLPPLSVRKVPFGNPWDGELRDDKTATKVNMRLRLTNGDKGEDLLDETEFEVPIRKPTDTHKRTFVSSIDGSVQYYSVVPQSPPTISPPADTATVATTTDKPALVLSLHGASVEATSQAAAYRAKDWCTIVCPTNRRSYGFDWEDWGRLDALEVLNLAQKELDTDPRRVYLTGHSMGGHGTWNVGVQFPDRFAAIAPSAGWVSFLSYGGAAKFDNPTPVQQMLLRANATSDTLSMSRNFLQQGIYILHGDADDNVPVTQARTMRKHLADFHTDFAYYEQPGAGHWWGNECLDWPPLFEFLKRHSLKDDKDVKHIEFVTPTPGTSAKCHWVTIWQQTKAMMPSKVNITFDEKKRAFVGTTENVAMLSLDRSRLRNIESQGDISVSLDGETFSVPKFMTGDPGSSFGWSSQIGFVRDDKGWRKLDLPEFNVKRPDRAGPFKSALQNHVVFVYGTTGSDAENTWAAAKARYDAENFWYRGNGSVDVISDTSFADSQRVQERELQN